MKKVLIIHGPNLNLLGERDPEVYGLLTLVEINRVLRLEGKKLKIILKIYQSNSEGKIIDKIQSERKWASAILINPAAYTHYSIAIRDALSATSLPIVEVHLSNIYKRESFRKKSVIRDICKKTFYGKKLMSYIEGLRYISKL